MSKKNGKMKAKTYKRAERMKLTPEESLKRMLAFDERREQFIAAIRKGKNRSVCS